jgi:hypothetical protein
VERERERERELARLILYNSSLSIWSARRYCWPVVGLNDALCGSWLGWGAQSKQRMRNNGRAGSNKRKGKRGLVCLASVFSLSVFFFVSFRFVAASFKTRWTFFLLASKFLMSKKSVGKSIALIKEELWNYFFVTKIIQKDICLWIPSVVNLIKPYVKRNHTR